MLLNRQLALDVLSAWERDQSDPHRGRLKKTIPSEQDFYDMLDLMFQTSLLTEEGKSVLTSVTWISQDDFNTQEVGQFRRSKLTLNFDTPITCSARNLTKLNGVVNGKTGTLLIFRQEPEICIWGICYFMGKIGPFGEIPASTEETRHFSPDRPTITIMGIGSLQISRGGSIIGRIENGKFMESQPSVLTSYMLGQYTDRLIGVELNLATNRFNSPSDANISYQLRDCIDFIVEILSQRRVGATVILVPNDKIELAQSETDTAWGVSGTIEIKDLQQGILKHLEQARNPQRFSNVLFALKNQQALRYRLRSLMDLAGIDGALLLTPSFEVIGFGMKIKSQKWPGQIHHGPIDDPTKTQDLDFSRLGTRHNSALNFVGRVNGAIAFVASSDGPIRALVKSTEEKIWYWPDCRVSMFTK